MTNSKKRAPRNRTLSVSAGERKELGRDLFRATDLQKHSPVNKIVHSSYEALLPYVADHSINLLFLDPPYNLTKKFNRSTFTKRSVESYSDYMEMLLKDWLPKLAANATVYICGDWKTSVSIYEVAARHFKVRNRITWEREKGRGAKANWKNCTEDIWFCTLGDDYIFNADAVRQRRAVIAPYKDKGRPKDWVESEAGNYRDTAPSNFMSDITIPFWSMPENTDHPTQKSEKLVAKLVLASTNRNDLVCDPFLGSGTSAVVAKKLGRRFIGCEVDEEFSLLAQKRFNMADEDQSIQGYRDGVFWDRNSLKK